MRNSLPIMSLLVALAMLLTAAPTAARSQIAIGASNPVGSDLSALDAHIADVGRKPAMWSLWSNWGSRGGQVDCQPSKGDCAFPTATVAALQARGIDPVIWWLPTDPGNWEAGRYERYKRIINGKHDTYIKQWARDAKQAALASGRPIFIRFAQEAAGIWFPWSIGRFDNTT